jgi:hypothetical protein
MILIETQTATVSDKENTHKLDVNHIGYVRALSEDIDLQVF